MLLPENRNVSFSNTVFSICIYEHRGMDREKKLHGSRSKNLNQKERGVGQNYDTKFLFCDTQNNSQYA